MPRVADDYRVRIEFADEGHGLRFGRALSERQLAGELRERLGDRVVVTRDGPHVFMYAGGLDQAHAAQAVAREALAEHELRADVSAVERWHPVEERWEDAAVPLPETRAEEDAERRRWEERQAAEAAEEGYTDWEVRIDVREHGDAVELGDRLEREGLEPLVRRWKYILIGVPNENEARALAERLRAEAPEGAEVRAEPSAAVAWEVTSRNPFAIFGGFGPGP
jgi:hypothetical protein